MRLVGMPFCIRAFLIAIPIFGALIILRIPDDSEDEGEFPK